MDFAVGRCPVCSKEIQIATNKKQCFCMYCGNQIDVEFAIGGAAVDSIESARSLVHTAIKNITNNDFASLNLLSELQDIKMQIEDISNNIQNETRKFYGEISKYEDEITIAEEEIADAKKTLRFYIGVEIAILIMLGISIYYFHKGSWEILAGIFFFIVAFITGGIYFLFRRNSKKQILNDIELAEMNIEYAYRKKYNREHQHKQEIINLKSMIPIYKKKIMLIQEKNNNDSKQRNTLHI